MKKTLIALMIASGSTMCVSGVAQAYQSSFGGGEVSFGGTITTPENTIYESKVASVTGLDATIRSGDSSATIAVPTNAGLLAVRSIGGFESSASNKLASITFNGQSLANAAGGIKFTDGKIDLTLPAKDSDGNDIGSVTIPVQVAAVSATVDKNNTSEVLGQSLCSDSDLYAFWGGLPVKPAAAVQGYDKAFEVVNNMFSDITDNFPSVTTKQDTPVSKAFSADDKTFYTAYAAGINQGDDIVLSLNNPATAGSMSWTASIPVVISYK